MSDSLDDEWGLSADDAQGGGGGLVLRIRARPHMNSLSRTSRVAVPTGLPVLRVGSVLRVPRFALLQLVTTGQLWCCARLCRHSD